MFLFVYFGISFSVKFAPAKIKILSLAVLIILSFRYIALLIFLITENIKSLYLLKPFIFLNLLCIPIFAVITIYIFARNDKIKFNFSIIAAIVLLLIYVAAIIKLSANIEVYENLGYIMSFKNYILVDGIYLFLNTMIFFMAIVLLGDKNANKLGMWLIIASTFVVIFELITRFCGITILPAILFGDMMWIISVDYALYKLKK
jgi:hypothetical protein